MNDKIVVDSLTGGYEGKQILRDIQLKIPEGKMTIIIGPNGCGKSTLLKTIGRFLRPQAGTVFLDDQNVHETPTKKLAQQLSVLPQSPIAPEGLRVEEMVAFGRHPYQKGLSRMSREDREVIDWALEVTALTPLKEAQVSSLSGGQRQRAWIAMTLAQKTDTILFDEPTTYLDIAYQLEILELLQMLNRRYGTTIVIVLHDINLSARFADYMVAMHEGKIVKEGTPAEVIVPEVLRRIYHIDADIVMDTKRNVPVCLSYELENKKMEAL